MGTESNMTCLPHNKDKLMKYLITLCDQNEVDVIIIISDIDGSSVISDATQKVINKNVSENIATLISELELKLESIFNRCMCGVRNKTVLLNISGSLGKGKICLEQIETQILKIIDLITPSETALNDDNVQEDIKNGTNCSKKSYIEVIEAQKLIRDAIIQSNEEIESECVRVQDAYGRILLKDIYSKYNVPSFKASAKHGYAIKANDKKNIKKILRAGTSSLKPGTCIWVKTGAPIPHGATAVVQVENTKEVIKECDDNNTDDIEEEEKEIEIIIQPKEGENIRPIGSERKIGEKILDKYTRIGPVEIGLLASCGYKEVKVIGLPTIGILSIGNKLGESGKILRLKHVYDGNRLTLITLLKQEGFDALDCGIVNYKLITNIICKIEEALVKVNVLVIASSTNERDLLKHILQEYFKATIYFDCVNVKPGKSTIYAPCTLHTCNRKKYLLCLSGNPANVLIAAHLFLLPLLNQMRRNNLEMPVIIPACLMDTYIKHSRPSYKWTYLQWDVDERDTYPQACNMENRDSNLLKSHNANALLMLPAASNSEISLKPGTFVPALFLDSK
ncbi:unnamed protein product [Lasius platythorax]